MKVSIVISTYNRRDMLERTLLSLQQLRYRNFEVVVVDGPSTDGTAELLGHWQSKIKVAKCSEANLSKSRNIGIDNASGDIVAFIDDDAIPHPCWLDNIIAGYDSDDIGGVGGFTYDHTGHAFQAKYTVADRLGGAESTLDYDPSYAFSVPYAPKYSAHLGTNSTFRRAALVEVGGFDEEYAYYLDETDVCLRLIDAGYVVRQMPLARVYHKFARSHLRSEHRVLTDRYQILKNQAYFAMRHGSKVMGYEAAISSIGRFVDKHRNDVNWAVDNKLLPPTAKRDFEITVKRALDDGVRRAIAAKPIIWNGQGHLPVFRRFSDNSLASNRLTICLLTKQYRPSAADGIGRFVAELADGLVAEGHTVHVLTRSTGHSTVDLEDGVWVHRLQIESSVRPRDSIPEEIWNYSATMLKELREIDELDSVDIVQAPAWDCEGLAILLDGKFRLVTSIHTPMLVAASMTVEWLTSDTLQSSNLSIAEWERRLFLLSDGIYANSQGCVKEVETAYSLRLGTRPVAVVPHGIADAPVPYAGTSIKKSDGWLDVLFIGRLEYRKGIDQVLMAASQLLAEFPRLRIHVAGAPPPGEDNPVAAWKKAKLNDSEESWRDRLSYYGRADQDVVDEMLARCDVFIAPSRFESFGLVYIEAMRHAKPVVGSAIGGIAEVVEDGATGILVPPGDGTAFTAALRSLLLSKSMREQMGNAGRERYLARFTAATMARNSLTFYRQVIDDEKGPVVFSTGQLRRCTLDAFVPPMNGVSVVEKVCGQAVDCRGWAFAQGVEIAKAMHVRNNPVALVIGPEGAPAIEEFVPGWRTVWLRTKPNRQGMEDGTAEFIHHHVVDSMPNEDVNLLLHLDVLPVQEGDLRRCLKILRRGCKPGGTILTLMGLPTSLADARTQGDALTKVLAESGFIVPPDLAEQISVTYGQVGDGGARQALDPHITAFVQGLECDVAALQLQAK